MKKRKVPKVKFKKITSVEDIEIVNAQIVDAFSKHIAEIAKDFMQDYINEKIYLDNVLTDGSKPKSYDRTGDLLNAVVCTYTSKGEWKIGLDGRKIHARARGSYTDAWGEHVGWGQHSDIDGGSQSGDMASFINDGNDSPLFGYEGIDFIGVTQNYINGILKTEWEKFEVENSL